jgi:hypothetical protein
MVQQRLEVSRKGLLLSIHEYLCKGLVLPLLNASFSEGGAMPLSSEPSPFGG